MFYVAGGYPINEISYCQFDTVNWQCGVYLFRPSRSSHRYLSVVLIIMHKYFLNLNNDPSLMYRAKGE